jgi:hypothetical protein
MASYETYNIYIKNTAFTYDNAVAAMAFYPMGTKPRRSAFWTPM